MKFKRYDKKKRKKEAIRWKRDLGRIPGLVVMGRDSHLEGRWFDSQHHILDGHFSHLFVVKIVMMFV